MRGLVDKTVMLAVCLALSVTVASRPPVWFVVAALVAVCAAALAEWAGTVRLRCLIALVCAAAACVVPYLDRFLPVFAYDARRVDVPGRLRDDDARPVPPAWVRAAGWLWLAPLLVLTVRSVATVPSGIASIVSSSLAGDAALSSGTAGPAVARTLAIVPLTLAGALFGAASARADRLALALSRTEDETRDIMRRQRSRIADGEEERAASIRVATLGERTRIAREIHDNVGHLLTRAIMQAEAGRLTSEAAGETTAARGFARIEASVDEAMTMVRRSVHDLEDDGTDFAAQIEAAAHSLDADGPGFAVELDNAVGSAPAPVARCLATVIREALANVAHHSHAGRVTVVLHDFPAFWQLAVQDDGGAVSRPGGAGSVVGRGMGLADIDARVRALGGTAVCGPYGPGWRVFVSIPKAPWRGEDSGDGSGGAPARPADSPKDGLRDCLKERGTA